MRIDHDALVMVVDGGKMLLFRNEGDADYPNLIVETASENVNPPDREQHTDAPGRAFASVGAARSAMGETDFHDLSEDRFAADAVELLNQRALANRFERLIVVAPPAVLGEMRKHYNKALSARLVGEIAKDLTGHPVPDIEKVISDD
jgi:protein required for attachment to host cells